MGNPKPKIHWLKDGQKFEASPPSAEIQPDGSLMLKSGTTQDAGQYSCQAISPAGNATVSVQVKLIKKPTILMMDSSGSADGQEEKLVARAGERLDIPCPVVVPPGQPQPKVIWTLDSLAITSPEYQVLRNYTLRISQVGSVHGGNYICTAINAAGETEKQTKVVVHTIPSIARSQNSFSLVQGDTITLPCEVEGEPEPQVQWYLNGQEFEDAVLDEDNALILDEVSDKHRGEFKCVATNALGSQERTVTVTVHTAPVIEGSGGTVSLLLF
uniref:Ig-like domain-containing protein n=1 Tax=Ditylenchus dipsaci TaxID=166011 RepID=A0A915CT19_9BILA